jgi:hypothetical protein
MPLLIGLTGRARVGKDTAASFLANDYLLKRYAFAQPIKDAAEAMGFARSVYDNDDMKERVIQGLGVSYRRILQTLGTEWGRSLNPDFWLLLAKLQWEQVKRQGVGMVISDVRFANEANWIRSEGGLLIHIDGPVRADVSEATMRHASENGVERDLGDVVVSNIASLDFLQLQLRSAVERFRT